MSTSTPAGIKLNEKINDFKNGETDTDLVIQSAQQKKAGMSYLKYDIAKMATELGIPEEKILFSSKKIPKGWDRKKYYPNQSLKSFLAHRIIATVVNKKISSIEELKNHYLSIVHMEGIGTPEECAFIRYSRHYFLRK